MVAILTGYGINADQELAQAFTLAGAESSFIHIRDLMTRPGQLKNYSILAFPGGFSFGDHIGSGTLLAHIVRSHLRPAIEEMLARGALVLGICNGFQTLVKMGLLPNTRGDWSNEVSLVHNRDGCFIDRWVGLKVEPRNSSPWLRGIEDFDCPIRHGEGQFIAGTGFPDGFPDELVAFRYAENPNGSHRDIAGITDPSGRILGMMPHPEAFTRAEQHPLRLYGTEGAGLRIFRNAVDHFRR